MQDAVYGLLGALGGAVLAGAATYWGPLQAQKAARREAERQREQAQAEAAAAKVHEHRSAQVARVALIRRVVGNWCHLLEVTLDEVQQGHPAEDFWQGAHQARHAVAEAIYDGLRDGFAIVATRDSVRRRRRTHVPLSPLVRRTDQPLGRIPVSDRTMRVHESEQELILDALDLATSRVGVLVRLPTDDSRYQEALQSARIALDGAGQARADLSVQLMQRLMDIADLDVIDTRRDSGPANP
ncbi:hypothetical protein QF030_000490 [Streptomyces rishiriensis]|uniref:Secreted protein n=1 Tax=Streptomyces rishiriensis TaxID=68264 RepID=A0ABU0NGS5_STRRH|nr:hypothetical protein [Streptomyces rishiriensis]